MSKKAKRKNHRNAQAVLAMIFVYLAPSLALPAPCCGGHAAIPSLITGYEHYRLNSSWVANRVIGDAPSQGVPVFRRSQDQADNSTLNLSGSARLADRLQVGAALAASPTASSMGDTDLMVAFEARQRPDISDLAPQVLVFAQATLPTGRSIYETREPFAKDVTGAGFYRWSLGTVALSTWHKWDAYSLLRATASSPREFENGQNLRVSPGVAGDVAFGVGYSINGDWRVGGSVQSSFSEGKATETASGSDRSGSSLVWPVQAQVTWFKDSSSALSLSYLDETLIGPAKNTTLSRSVALQYSYRWGGEEQ